MTGAAQTFHVDLLGRFGLLSVFFFAPVLWIAADSLPTLLIGVAFIIVAEFLTYFLCTVVVNDEGIVLNRAYTARWQDMTAAKQVSFLGLPYLKLERDKNLKWWVPLYLTRPNEFRLALTAKAPVGNPMREYAERNI